MTKTRDLSDFLIEGGADLPLGKPHIVPDVLYPAVSGNDLSGTALGGSYVYGTAHTDGRKYYYTDIKGSKPIKDPRIGGHFGSQRHTLKSKQLLEQETATHGSDVYSIDGREWIRFADADGGLEQISNPDGQRIRWNSSADTGNSFLEVTGYFNLINILTYTSTNRKNLKVLVDGVENISNFSTHNTSIATPLGNRYVDASSSVNIPITGVSLGLHTLRLTVINTNTPFHFYGIELIAQDTASTARRSEIKIPKQNVVSFGKKFEVGSDDLDNAVHPHYDPFNGFTSGSSVSSYVDTATSLGLDKWLHSSNYYRPYNGGRVVKWVDSSGVIKTSVTLMPPNAKSIADSSSLTNATAKANASASNDTFYPTFEAHTTDVNEDQLHEVAKTFHVREFGNGSANGGTGATYADASMVDTAANQDVAFVMDDGLTSFSADNIYCPTSLKPTGSIMAYNPNDFWYVTFIGTGVTSTLPNGNKYTIAQNLPFGTHIIKAIRGADSPSTVLPDYYIDGIELDQVTENFAELREITFHQPKKPPIPEDACVLADYMLMADYVKQTDCEATEISKGVRYVSGTRDHFCDSSSAFTNNVIMEPGAQFGLAGFQSSSTNDHSHATLHFFGTTGQSLVEASDASHTVNLPAGTATTETALDSTDNENDQITIAESVALGQTSIKTIMKGSYRFYGHHVVTPIHTSSHYQSFETPFLHELVGGDRNMEQTNLVVSPDGKTWDQITRDTSYLASDIVLSTTNNTTTGWYAVIILDEWRGQPLHNGATRAKECFNKDSWAIGYDRLICLKDGTYEMFTSGEFDSHQDIYINGVAAQLTPNSSHSGIKLIKHLNRGDWIQPSGDFGDNSDVRYSHFYIKKIN